MTRIFCFLALFITLLTQGTAQASSGSPLTELAQKYSEAGNHQASYDSYWLAFKQEPGSIEINYKLGLEAAQIADYESAVMAFERVLLIDPKATQATIELAKSFYKLGDLTTAKRYFSEALKADDLPPEAKQNILSFLNNLK